MYPNEPQTHLSGLVDLLYAIDDEWHIVDYKTADVPSDGSYLANQYRWQLATYEWLLQEECDIDADLTRLVYVQDGIEKIYDVDTDEFAAYLGDVPDLLTIEPERGLPTRPEPAPDETSSEALSAESRCGSCPFTTICDEWAN